MDWPAQARTGRPQAARMAAGGRDGAPDAADEGRATDEGDADVFRDQLDGNRRPPGAGRRRPFLCQFETTRCGEASVTQALQQTEPARPSAVQPLEVALEQYDRAAERLRLG